MFDPKKIKKDFPILNRKINGHTFTYLDNAATSQKPYQVIDALTNYYKTSNANIHRGIYLLAEEATLAFEETRNFTAKFINAKYPKEIIFTNGTTGAINLVAYSWGEKFIKEGDEIIVSAVEHHSNLISWQALSKRKKAKLRIIPLKKDLTLDFEAYKKLLNKKTKLLALSAMSNVTGLIVDTKKFIKEAKKHKVISLIDGAQYSAHLPTDVQDIDCDFFCFSSHKMLGPTGVGVLYGKKSILEKMPPFLYGGDMIKNVNKFTSTYKDIPYKFEAGTPNIADIIAFKEALRYLQNIGLENIHKHEQKLLKLSKERFSRCPHLRMYTSPHEDQNGGILSFSLDHIHPHDVAQIFDRKNVYIRAGHHCAEPLMKTLKIPALSRISFYLYNTEEDIEKAEKALKEVYKIFKI